MTPDTYTATITFPADCQAEADHIASLIYKLIPKTLHVEMTDPEPNEEDWAMKFRKKPVVIEAFQMTKERRWDNSEWPNWLHQAWNKAGEGALYCVDAGEELFIGTLEGVHAVCWGDWIIQGVQGELYPCKPDIFEATYEPVRED